MNSDSREFKSNIKQEAIRILLSKGAKPMYGSKYPIHEYMTRVKYADIETMRAFLNKGADFNWYLITYGTTMLGYTFKHKRYDIGKLLLENGTDPNFCNNVSNSMKAPLHYAIENNSFEAVEMLIAHGANVQAKDFWNCKPSNSALDFAIKENKDQRIIDYLIQNGAR